MIWRMVAGGQLPPARTVPPGADPQETVFSIPFYNIWAVLGLRFIGLAKTMIWRVVAGGQMIPARTVPTGADPQETMFSIGFTVFGQS